MSGNSFWVASKIDPDKIPPTEILGICNTLIEAQAFCIPPDVCVDYKSYWYQPESSGRYILTNPEWDVLFSVAEVMFNAPLESWNHAMFDEMQREIEKLETENAKLRDVISHAIVVAGHNKGWLENALKMLKPLISQIDENAQS